MPPRRPPRTGADGLQGRPPAGIAPRCQHEGACGGCGWQHLAYEDQLAAKRRQLESRLRSALGDLVPTVLPVLDADGRSGTAVQAPWGFRHKVHFVCAPGRAEAPLTLGHFATGGQSVVPVTECPVHAEAGNRTAFGLLETCRRLGVPGATPDGRSGLLRHIVVRVGRATGEQLVTLVVTDARDPRVSRLTAALADAAQPPDGLHVNVLRGRSSYLFGPETRKIRGHSWLREQVAGLSFLVGPTAFFQTNVSAAETLVRLVLDAVPAGGDHVLDLYAGTGLFALPLARRGHRVLGIEEYPAAVESGRRSQRLNAIDGRDCRLVCSRAEDLPAVRAQAVVLDPPRRGCAERVLRKLAREVQPEVLVYVSCDPESLARDLRTWFGCLPRRGPGYRIATVQPLDMFPHTPHLETVVTLHREGTTAPSPGGGGRTR